MSWIAIEVVARVTMPVSGVDSSPERMMLEALMNDEMAGPFIACGKLPR